MGGGDTRGGRLEVACRRRVGALRLDVRWECEPAMTALIGPSGAGKTQLLHLIAGLERPDHGRIAWRGRTFDDVARRAHLPSHRRRLGVVFQHSRLFPHLSVADNLAYSGRNRQEGARWDEVIAELGLAPLLARHPASLSGGERQRVALGRCLLAEPELLLLDEPVSALDLPRRLRFMDYLRRVHQRFGVPVIFVTHDPELVRHFATDAALMVDGQIRERGDARSVLATGLGGLPQVDTNLFRGRVSEDGDEGATVEIDGAAIRVAHTGLEAGTPVWLRVLGSDLVLMRGAPAWMSARNVLEGQVTEVAVRGDRAWVEVDAGVRWRVEVLPSTVKSPPIEVGQTLSVVAKATAFQVLRR